MAEADGYRLFQRCARREANEIKDLVISSCKGSPTVLDIGAGNGMFLKTSRIHSHYYAFEKDPELFAELKEACKLDGHAKCFNETFCDDTDVEMIDPVDVVLLSHCLYGHSAKLRLVDHALRFLKTDGVLLVVHRWNSGTLEEITKHLTSQDYLVRTQVWDTEISLHELTPSEREMMAAYTNIEAIVTSSTQVVVSAVGSIAIEKNLFLSKDRMKLELVATRGRVGFLAKQKDPFAVIRPATPTGIAAAVQCVARKEIPCSGISCVGGGHSANCLGQNALVVDLSLWNDVTVNVDKKCVTVGGGAVIGEVTRACEEHGLFAPLGDRPSVGAGLILQGGLNHFMRRYGLASDGIQSVEFINAAGETMFAKTPDQLLPFLQGAGTNFGVVLGITLRCHTLLGIQAQDVLYRNPTILSDLMVKYSEKALLLPKEQSLDGFLFWTSSADVSFATSLFTVHDQSSSPPDEERLVLGDYDRMILSSEVNLKPTDLYDRELYMSDLFSARQVLNQHETEPTKLRSIKFCLFFEALSLDISKDLCELMVRAPTKWCYVHFLHGLASAADLESTVGTLGRRDWNFAAVITGRWPDGSPPPTNWIDQCKQTLLPRSTGVYSADLGPTDAHLAPNAYGRSFLELNRQKRHMDPHNLFRHGCSLHRSFELNDPSSTNKHLLVAICGRRCSGKDWLGDRVAAILRKLCSNNNVLVSSISDSVKSAYAKAGMGRVDLDRLRNDRRYKEHHRQRLSDFYVDQKKREMYFDERCLLECIDAAPNDGILILTGLRHGLETVRDLAGCPVVMIKVEADDDVKQSRSGWTYSSEIDGSTGEKAVDSHRQWDLVYCNDESSSTEAAELFVFEKLLPTMFRRMVRQIPDAPSPNMVYQDISGGPLLYPFFTPLWAKLVRWWLSNVSVDAICSPECLGLVLAGSVAAELAKPFILIRKGGKIHGRVRSVKYPGSNISQRRQELSGVLEIADGAIVPGQRIVLVDDCRATGETMHAVRTLIERAGGVLVAAVFFMEFADQLRHESNGVRIFSAIQYTGP